MSRAILQVPVDPQVRRKAERKAKDEGLSLQDFVRVVLRKYADDKLEVSVQEPGTIQLSPRAIKRYNKIVEEIESGKVKTKTFTDADSLKSPKPNSSRPPTFRKQIRT